LEGIYPWVNRDIRDFFIGQKMPEPSLMPPHVQDGPGKVDLRGIYFSYGIYLAKVHRGIITSLHFFVDPLKLCLLLTPRLDCPGNTIRRTVNTEVINGFMMVAHRKTFRRIFADAFVTYKCILPFEDMALAQWTTE
jgi:hypothetical protein